MNSFSHLRLVTPDAVPALPTTAEQEMLAAVAAIMRESVQQGQAWLAWYDQLSATWRTG